MCHLLLSDSFVAQQMAFSIIQPATQKFTEHVVIEAAIETSDETTIDLPIELLEVIRKALETDDLQQDNVSLEKHSYIVCQLAFTLEFVCLSPRMDGYF